jgi:hypothetical protein
MVEILLHYNADPTLQNTRNETAYSLAVKSGRKVVSMILAEADRKYSTAILYVYVPVCRCLRVRVVFVGDGEWEWIFNQSSSTSSPPL